MSQTTLDEFSENYAQLECANPEWAKDYFREKFLVKCFGCNRLIKPVKPMNCPVCKVYLD